MLEEKENRLLQLGKELQDQKSKLDRVTKQNLKYIRELRTETKVKDETPEEVRVRKSGKI